MTPEGVFLFFLFDLITISISIVVFVYLFILSIVVNDYKIIVERPFLFTIEFLFMMILPSIPLLFFMVSRSIPFDKAMFLAVSFAVQAGLFHIVCQLSGVYRYSFGV